MKIFMDRHDVSEGVTAEDVARLHQEDLKIQHKFGCTGLTYWFDEERKTAFCLIQAENKEAIVEMHNNAHGEVPHRVIEVNPEVVESFLGRIEDPEADDHSELNIIDDPAYRFIMSVSVRFTNEDYVDSDTYKALQLLIGSIVLKHHGSVIDQQFDRFTLSFFNVSETIDAALEIETQTTNNHPQVSLSIGISGGEPVTEKESLFEDTLKLSKRLCNTAKTCISISEEVDNLWKCENPADVLSMKNINTLSSSEASFMHAFVNLIEKDYSKSDLRIEDMCNALHYSHSGLFREVKKLSGKSPTTLLRDIRLDHALGLLSDRNHTVGEVTFATGFSSPSYFSKCFQKRYNISPSKYQGLHS